MNLFSVKMSKNEFKLDFRCPSTMLVAPVLRGEMIEYFYRNIAFESVKRGSIILVDDKDFFCFANRCSLNIKKCKDIEIPNEVPDNTIIFSIVKKKRGRHKTKESMAVAFFRHLRNAFAHFLVYEDGNYLIMCDEKKKGRTCLNKKCMVGRIEYSTLKEFCDNLLFKAGCIKDEIDNSNNTEHETN